MFFRHLLFVEVSFAEDEEVAGRVVARRGVAHELGVSQLVDVPVAVDADVIGDVDPALRVLVVALVLADASRGVAVVAEDHGGVVDRHAGEGVGRAAGAGGAGAPGVAAQQNSRSGARRRCGRGHGLWWRAGRRAVSRPRRCSRARLGGGLGWACGVRAGTDGGDQSGGASQPEQPATGDELRAVVGPVGRRCSMPVTIRRTGREPPCSCLSGDLKRRIDDLLAAGTVDLRRVCGPDAAAIVAAIEAGN